MANTTTPSISTETMDYFSLLPQELIHSHILPKLFTKEAARTTILSKRWRSLWTSLPYLEFYQFHFHHTISFRNFVDHTIRDHARTATDILTFKLFLTHGIQVSDIDNWVRLVMSRNVREFHLRFLGRETYKWPSINNACMAHTITVLELYNCEVRFNSSINNIRLPHLQSLSLEKVWIDQRSIEMFITGCGSMNDLKIWNCYEMKYLVVANHQKLRRCNYIVVLEDWESIAELPYEVIDGLLRKAMCISNMSFSQMAEWFLNHSLCFSRKLLIISSSDSKFYKVLKEKRPNCYSESSSFTMTREGFERNTGISIVSMNNINGENDHKIAFFDALFEVCCFNTKLAIVVESL
ncbi:hypothetical protein Lal_00037873 [Lupinus albus]|nr:hypothetical protein Lal_00037873 [Lupinus albus]